MSATLERTQKQSRRPDSGRPRALILSAFLHALAFTGFLLYEAFPPKKNSAVPVFELMAVEPKLRPVAPKTIEPPPPPPKEETKAPQAPKLTAKPKVVAAPRPEPKVVRRELDETPPKIEKDIPKEVQQLTTTIVAHVPSDPILSFWASRVKKRVESLWKPPTGIEVSGRVKTVVSFQVGRDGKISGVAVSQSSGNALLDDQAESTILRVDQVPPIPPNYPEDLLQVSYEFVYQGQ